MGVYCSTCGSTQFLRQEEGCEAWVFPVVMLADVRALEGDPGRSRGRRELL